MNKKQLKHMQSIIDTVIKNSVARKLFTTTQINAGDTASIVTKQKTSCWVLPGLGYVAQNFVENIRDEIYVPTFTIDSSADWRIVCDNTKVPTLAAKRCAMNLCNYEEDSAFDIIIRSATTSFINNTELNICKIAKGLPGYGYLSVELLYEMFKSFETRKKTLTDICVGPKDVEDLKKLDNLFIDPKGNLNILIDFKGKSYTVAVHGIGNLGTTGKYNINGHTSEFGKFIADKNNIFNNYSLSKPNILTSEGTVVTQGETQIYGFDKSIKKNMIMVVRKKYEIYNDPTLLKAQRHGFFGWEEVGYVFLENLKNPRICMGIIDRSK